ncbi:condensin-2 complex subunit H2 [Cucumis sativus]|uniref:Condensin-2 complex subunit H2 n=1 Tax=Cucumis sativus TaxID=3659 RepID=A0A0A0K0I9_CUCSA|nr:condensin-2 complex subunit H2 [Cucumis sativus]XP_011658584.1 condensin-2 complex subunit H2 [Cucumis sativus]
MTTDCTGDAAFDMLQPERDLRLNWEVDLAQNLERYLLQICSGEFQSDEDENHTVNFAEAALLLQGSIQVYSRKVEYLYSLVLRALEFLSERRQQHHLEGNSIEAEQNGSHKIDEGENDLYWVSEDVPVDPKNTLDSTKEDVWLNQTVKPPANLIVLEGDCLDSSDNGELDSYLLATASNIFQDFILLDSSDVKTFEDFMNENNKFGKSHNSARRGSSTRRSCQSQSTMQRSSFGKTQVGDHAAAQSPLVSGSFVHDPLGNSESDDSNGCEDDDDFWKPLNPHEPGNLKIKPFRKVKAFKKNYKKSGKHEFLIALFPMAKLHGPVSQEFAQIWEEQNQGFEAHKESKSVLLYEKLRNSLINEGHKSCDSLSDMEDDNIDNGFEDAMPDVNHPDIGDPNDHFMDEAMCFGNEKHDVAAHFDNGEAYEPEFPDSRSSLEDLCRSHLDALLASIAESEKQTEMATRVSTWKQNIEHNLEDQDKHPPFDIHEYGQAILEELSSDADRGGLVPFSNVVERQEKYNVARSFSALLQLVNNGDVELEKNGVDGESICYTNVNPFYIRLVRHKKQVSRERFLSPCKTNTVKESSVRDKKGRK